MRPTRLTIGKRNGGLRPPQVKHLVHDHLAVRPEPEVYFD
jgi:hypothetical protein